MTSYFLSHPLNIFLGGSDQNGRIRNYFTHPIFLDMSHGLTRGVAADGTGADHQVAQIKDDAPPPALLDAVADRLLLDRHPQHPMVSRVAICGEINRDDRPRNFIEDTLVAVTKKVETSEGRRRGPGAEQATIGGIYIEMPSHFFCVLDSEPLLLQEALLELQRRLDPKRSGATAFEGIRKAHLVYYSDDVIQRAFGRFVAMDAPNTTGALPEGVALEDLIPQAVRKLLPLGTVTSARSDAAKQQQAAMPKTALVEKCLSCGLCLTLDEWAQVMGKVPEAIRSSEVLHPLEPQLKP